MRDTMKSLRLAVFNCINGNVSYESANVPIYDEKRKVDSSANVYILLGTQQETPTEGNDCTWITLSSIDIEIIARSGSEVSKDVIDDIGDSVRQLLLLTVSTSGLTVPSGFQFENFRFVQGITQNLSITETESILRKILKFDCTIVEQFP